MTDYIRNRIRQIECLPTFPYVVAEVMRIIDDPASSASDLVRHMDPSLVGEVLRAANSAYFGKKNFRRIANVEQAVVTIGYHTLSSIVLRMPLVSIIDGQDVPFDRRGFVLHSLSCAVFARAVGAFLGVGNVNTVYISGILHDVGIIIMHQFFKEECRRVNNLRRQERLDRPAAEKAVFGTDHASIGSMVLELWDIPETIIESVRLHHLRKEICEGEEQYAVWLANSLAKQIDSGKDLVDFETFFRKQREFLEWEMPERYLVGHDVDLFEKAYDQLKEIEDFLEGSRWGEG
ncbi:MAG: HDOD domain-containing protein [Syntrophorhabdales bacterium]|jgi:HD-like signal output (HDOD) protein